MGQRYEKSKKNVTENRQTLDGLKEDKETLQKEYAPLSAFESLQSLLDDEATEAIRHVSDVGNMESNRIENETDEAEHEKQRINEEINSEIEKLNSGLEKLHQADRIEFGKNAVEGAKQEYKRQIDKFNELLGELGVESKSGNGTLTEGIRTASDSVSDAYSGEKELLFFGEKGKWHESQSHSSNQETIRLQQMGINKVKLDGCHESNRIAVVNAVEKMFNEHPELRGQVMEVNCHSMTRVLSDGSISRPYASYGPVDFGSNFGGVLNLNSDFFSDPNLNDDLAEKSEMGWFIPNASAESVVEHELGHGMHLELCALSCGVKNGSIPDPETYNRVVQQYMDDMHADTIVENACASLGVDFDSWEFSRQLSKYGGSNYGEAIAEAVSEVEHNANPRPMATAIYRELINYKRNLERSNTNVI